MSSGDRNIKEIEGGKEWDEFVAHQEHAQFLQSSAWKIFQEKLGRPCTIVATIEHKKIRAGGLLVSLPLPIGFRYVYSPRGPLGERELVDPILAHIIRTKDPQTVFIRIEPPVVSPGHDMPGKKVVGFQVEHTLLLDLAHSEDELLQDMHAKTRYNIRLAEKKGVHVTRVKAGDSSAVQHVDTFIELLRITAERDAFHAHAPEHYRILFNTVPSYLYCAYVGEEMSAAILVIHFGDTTTYLHGASSDKHRNLMAPYLLQWEAIKDAKKAGKRYYDFWGISPNDSPTHPWAGITRFKKGFGGKMYQYPGTFEIPLNTFLYQGYRIGKFFSRAVS
ncbi:MAG: peptidoglycan bridge formation glycyltransferase FemA/FemB family protein [bacterium]|nr:peptidoglycan bridge formation glycyltransferase FemA/FemB family protein [bacterium]